MCRPVLHDYSVLINVFIDFLINVFIRVLARAPHIRLRRRSCSELERRRPQTRSGTLWATACSTSPVGNGDLV